jgi:ribosomal protein S18 acetylase RimI-like enzyme
MFTVRLAVPQDVDTIKRVSESGTRTLREVYSPSAKALANRQTLLTDSLILVAEFDDVIVGVMRLRAEEDRLHIFGLAVDDAFRKRGVARALLDEAMKRTQSLGKQAVSLYTVRETGNVQIFERLGFRTISERPDEFSVSSTFPVLTEVYMVRQA